jgi:hypothetical protein
MKIKLGNRDITIRKWKAREKKEFLNIVRTSESLDSLQDVLVYNCIEEKVALNAEEFKYILTQIRSYSLGEEIELEFYCESCKSKFLNTISLNSVVKPVFSSLKQIKTKNYNIKMGEIKNIDFYKKTIKENPLEERDYDFYLRIDSINGDDSSSLDEIIEIFNEMDIDEFDSIFSQWENMRFKIDDVTEIKCLNCDDVVKYSFDEIPGFFPPSWFK